MKTILGEGDPDEDEQRADWLVPNQGFPEEHDADEDREDGSEIRDTAGNSRRSVADYVEIQNVGNACAEYS